MGLLLALLLSQTGATNVPGVQLRDEGTSQGQVTALNCSGAGISCTKSGSVGTLSVSGGGGGGGNFVSASVDLSTAGGLIYSATIAAAWVTAGSVIICSPAATAADGQTLETYYAAGFVITWSNPVAGVGFDVAVFSPHGATGIFRFHCTGSA